MKHKVNFIIAVACAFVGVGVLVVVPTTYGFVVKSSCHSPASGRRRISSSPADENLSIGGGGGGGGKRWESMSMNMSDDDDDDDDDDEEIRKPGTFFSSMRRAVISSTAAAAAASWPILLPLDDNEAKAMIDTKNVNASTISKEDDAAKITNRNKNEEGGRRSLSVDGGGTLTQIDDIYPALVYTPPPSSSSSSPQKYPVLIVLHGAGTNEEDVWNLANIKGEHAGLIPSLLLSGMAPKVLLENFIVIAPYSYQKRSFYDEPRGKILQCIQSICDKLEDDDKDGKSLPQSLQVKVDRSRQYLFGFSDGATLGVELMTTRKFAAGVFAAYGFTGTLPQLALDRLKGRPMWIFHSADDVIFPVWCSDRLVKDLRSVNRSGSGNRGGGDGDVFNFIKYSRFERDQEGFTGAVRGHSTGITASKDPEIYKWLLSL